MAFALFPLLCRADGLDDAISAIRSVGPEGQGHEGAISAAATLQELSSPDIPRVLDGASNMDRIAENWIRGIVFGITRRSGPADSDVLRNYVLDKQKNPIGRGLAMELLRDQDPDVAEKIMGDFLDDESLALREMAVENALSRAKALETTNKEEAVAILRRVLQSARHPKQLERIVKSLGDLGDTVTTADAFSLITDWKSVAPFDNSEGAGYARQFAPESSFADQAKVELTTEYEGKNGGVRWRDLEASGDEGIVDLAAAFDKEKGAVAYLYAEFESPSDQPAEARLGCINANKAWVNGKQIMANEVYHSGSMIDQYTAPIELQKGTNTILLKICQNEQEESWAQRWEFQFRITDPTGKGLRSGE